MACAFYLNKAVIKKNDGLDQGPGTFFPVKDKTVNILGLVDHPISVTTTQLCSSCVKTATDNM